MPNTTSTTAQSSDRPKPNPRLIVIEQRGVFPPVVHNPRIKQEPRPQLTTAQQGAKKD